MKNFIAKTLTILTSCVFIYALFCSVLTPICMLIGRMKYDTDSLALALTSYALVLVVSLYPQSTLNISKQMDKLTKTGVAVLAVMCVLFIITIIGFVSYACAQI